MEINYELREKDYLNFQLYHTSKNESVKKQRWITQFIVVVIVVAVAAYIYITGPKWVSYYVLAATIPAYFLFTFYSKLLYRFSLKNHVARLYGKSTPRKVSLSIVDEELIYDEGGYAKRAKIYSLQEIINIKNYLYLKQSENAYIIIPKKQLEDLNFVTNRLKDIADNYKIKLTNDLKWRWR